MSKEKYETEEEKEEEVLDLKDPYVQFAILFIGVGVVAYIATILADFLKAYVGLSMLLGA